MNTTTFDTYSFVKQMRESGLSEVQAASIVRFVTSVREEDIQAAATKADLRELELRLQSQLKDIQLRIGSMIVALGGLLVAVKYLG